MEIIASVCEVIGTLGFPIAAYLISMWMINKKDDASREDAKEHNKTINSMIEKYSVLSEGINNNTEALNNNTSILTTLVGELHNQGE